MHRIYIPLFSKTSETVILENPQEIHHLKDVLRIKIGQTVQLFNGKGYTGEGILEEITSKKVLIKIVNGYEETLELPLLILACAIPKRGKFETIIEKSTELGVDEIIPLRTKNTEVIFKAEKSDYKIERFQKIAMSAAKQSKRTTIPIIHPMTDFKKVVTELLKRSVVLIPSLTENRKKLIPTLEHLDSPSVISFLVGPEGDFSPQEYEFAHESGCLPVSLGKTVLKVETAAITSIAVTRLFFNG